MNRVKERFQAGLFRDFIVFRSWMWGLGIVAIAGPLINLLNAVGSPQASAKISALLLAVYSIRGSGDLLLQHGKLIGLDYRPHLQFVIQGYPTVGLWFLIVSVTLAALLACVERQSHTMVDGMNEPILRRQWISSRMLFGGMIIVVIGLVRVILMGGTNLASPYHVSFSLLAFAFLINTLVCLGCFSVAFAVSLLVGNVFIAFASSFLLLNLPLAVGSILMMFRSEGNDWPAIAYRYTHRGIKGISPTLYTQYGNETLPIPLTVGAPVKKYELLSGVQHPWSLVIGASVVIVLAFVVAQMMFSALKVERMSEWFVSTIAFHFFSTVASIVGASIVGEMAQPENRKYAWLPAAVVCYFVAWMIYRWLSGKRIWQRRQVL